MQIKKSYAIVAVVWLFSCSSLQQQDNSIRKNTLAASTMLPSIETGAKPYWDKTFPSTQYVSVISESDSPAQAAKNAQKEMRLLLNPQTETDDTRTLNPEIKIAALWMKENDSFHALAIFPQAEAARHLWQQIDTLDAMTTQDIANLGSSTDPLKKIGRLLKMIKRQQLRAAYQKSLKQIDLKKEGRESPWNTRRWSLAVEQHLSELLIIPTNTQQTELAILQNGLAHAGLSPTNKNDAQYTIKSELNVTYKDLANGWKKADGTLKVQLKNKAAHNVPNEKTWHIETTALNTDAATQRIKGKTKRLIEQQMKRIIKEIALSTAQ